MSILDSQLAYPQLRPLTSVDGSAPNAIRALVVDERGVVGEALQTILQRGLQVVGVASTAEQTFSAVSQGLPDIVLLCVWKKSGFGSMPAAIPVGVPNGRPPSLAGNGQLGVQAQEDPMALTPRERQVLTLLIQGASNKEMAKKLQIRSNTVRTHVQNVLTKLRVHTRLGAATLAMRQRLVEPGDLP